MAKIIFYGLLIKYSELKVSLNTYSGMKHVSDYTADNGLDKEHDKCVDFLIEQKPISMRKAVKFKSLVEDKVNAEIDLLNNDGSLSSDVLSHQVGTHLENKLIILDHIDLITEVALSSSC